MLWPGTVWQNRSNTRNNFKFKRGALSCLLVYISFTKSSTDQKSERLVAALLCTTCTTCKCHEASGYQVRVTSSRLDHTWLRGYFPACFMTTLLVPGTLIQWLPSVFNAVVMCADFFKKTDNIELHSLCSADRNAYLTCLGWVRSLKNHDQ